MSAAHALSSLADRSILSSDRPTGHSYVLAITSTRQLDEKVFFPFSFLFFLFCLNPPRKFPGNDVVVVVLRDELAKSASTSRGDATRRSQRPGLEKSRKSNPPPSSLVYPRVVALFYDFIGINEHLAGLASRIIKSYSQLLDSTRPPQAKLFRPRLHVVGITGISASVRFNEIIGERL